MHVSNLLRTVLKPQGLSSTSSKKPAGNSRANRRDGGLGSYRLGESSGELYFSNGQWLRKRSQSTPPKAACLCAPTNHPGSFRCRLHRSSQIRWGSRSMGYSSMPASGVSATTRTPSSSGSSMSSTFDLTSVGRTLPRVHSRIGFGRHRIRPSRLSRMVNATELEAVTVKGMEKISSQNLVEAALLKTFPGRSTTSGLPRKSSFGLQQAIDLAASSKNKEDERSKGLTMATTAHLTAVVNEINLFVQEHGAVENLS
ncbi:hypothetical protein O6H91_04G061200 [Diphasiastrum complanatum]|uniref:Uncharacterized protein n=1 Tax=Diphasiastrum complanatum TaxID=34168 RepID=A0ACC2DXB8_DIPCM|nr:hypothetical protein O6H91_04G061200 [Diphasiastrum complanatum]